MKLFGLVSFVRPSSENMLPSFFTSLIFIFCLAIATTFSFSSFQKSMFAKTILIT